MEAEFRCSLLIPDNNPTTETSPMKNSEINSDSRLTVLLLEAGAGVETELEVHDTSDSAEKAASGGCSVLSCSHPYLMPIRFANRVSDISHRQRKHGPTPWNRIVVAHSSRLAERLPRFRTVRVDFSDVRENFRTTRVDIFSENGWLPSAASV